MTDPAAILLGWVAMFWFFGALWTIGTVVLCTWAIVSVTRNVAGMRRALDRISSSLEHSPAAGHDARPRSVAEFSAGEVTSGFRTRTGSLDIR